MVLVEITHKSFCQVFEAIKWPLKRQKVRFWGTKTGFGCGCEGTHRNMGNLQCLKATDNYALYPSWK